jgi:hypothetical protein
MLISSITPLINSIWPRPADPISPFVSELCRWCDSVLPGFTWISWCNWHWVWLRGCGIDVVWISTSVWSLSADPGTPQKTEVQTSSSCGISFGIDWNISRLYYTSGTEIASHYPSQILKPAKTPLFTCDRPWLSRGNFRKVISELLFSLIYRLCWSRYQIRYCWNRGLCVSRG